jgi:hypothetical protein
MHSVESHSFVNVVNNYSGAERKTEEASEEPRNMPTPWSDLLC